MFWHSIKSGWYCELLSTPFFSPLFSFLFHISFAFCAWRCLHLLVLASHPVTLWVFLLYASYPFLIILPVLCYDYLPCTEHDDYPQCIKHNDSLFHASSVMISLPCIEHDDFFFMCWVLWPFSQVEYDESSFMCWLWWYFLHYGLGSHTCHGHPSFFLYCIMHIHLMLFNLSPFSAHLAHTFLTLVQISHAPPGTQICTLDIKKFHCKCPVFLLHKPWLIVQGLSDDFFINHAHPFRVVCASSNAGQWYDCKCRCWHMESWRSLPST